MFIPHCAEAGESTLNCLEQRVLCDRLRQEVLRAGFDDLNGRWDICLACQKNDGQAQSSCLQTVLQFEPAHARHFDIEKNAAGCCTIGQAFQQLICRVIGFDRITRGTQDAAGRGPEGGVVVNDVDDSRHESHPLVSGPDPNPCISLAMRFQGSFKSSCHSPKSVGISGAIGRQSQPLVPMHTDKCKLSFVPQNNHERVSPRGYVVFQIANANSQ